MIRKKSFVFFQSRTRGGLECLRGLQDSTNLHGTVLHNAEGNLVYSSARHRLYSRYPIEPGIEAISEATPYNYPLHANPVRRPFVLMYKQPKSSESTAITVDFMRWSLESGQPLAESLDYVPLPSALVQQI